MFSVLIQDWLATINCTQKGDGKKDRDGLSSIMQHNGGLFPITLKSQKLFSVMRVSALQYNMHVAVGAR